MNGFEGLEKLTIKSAFDGEVFFKSCCEDYLNYNKVKNKQDENILDLRKHTTTTGVDGVTTGIVCDVDFDEENGQLYFYLFVEGVFRWAVADKITRDSFIDIEKDIRQQSKGDTICFDFLKLRPFTLKMENGVVGMFKALPTINEELLDIYYNYLVA